MAQHLRQSTQTIVVIGPFVDVTDGFTPETGITLSGADEAEILKANTTTTTDISGATWAAITGCDGYYGLTLTTSHTDTVGPLTIMVNDDSVCLPVMARFQVIEEAAYDSFYAASADPKADINVASIDANAITATAIATDAITAAKIADGAIDAATFAAGAITATVIATGAIDADALAADAAAEIADAVWDEDATAHQTQGTFGQAIGDPAADTDTIYALANSIKSDTAAILADTGTDGVVVASIGANAITAAATAADFGTEVGTAVWASATRVLTANTNLNDPTAAAIADAVWDEAQADHVAAGSFGETATEIASILVDTGTTLDGKIDTIDTNVDAVLVDTGTTLDGLITTVDTVVDAIKVQTDKLTFTVANVVDANIQRVNDVAIVGDGSATPFNV